MPSARVPNGGRVPREGRPAWWEKTASGRCTGEALLETLAMGAGLRVGDRCRERRI